MKDRARVITLAIVLFAVGFAKAYAVEKVPERTEPPAKIPKTAPKAPAAAATPAPAPTPAPPAAPPAYASDISNAHCYARDAAAQGRKGSIGELRRNATTARSLAAGALNKMAFATPANKDHVQRAQNILTSALSVADVSAATRQVDDATQELARTGYTCSR